MACEECAFLATHVFRGPDDLVHAVQTAAQETDRGVLRRADKRDLGTQERAALDSAFETGHVPGIIRYRFECTSCDDGFDLVGNTETGEGSWRREGDPAPKASR